MTDEGKMSRAISKAGAAHRLSAAPEKTGEPPPYIVPEAAPTAEEGVSSFRLVRGRFGAPKLTVVMVHDKFGEVATQVRVLGNRLLAMNDDKPLRTITITSASSEEGKTTLALNLANPPRVLCSKDCKGICPKCGGNLNLEQCKCKT